MTVSDRAAKRLHLFLACLLATVALGACTLLADFPDFDSTTTCGNGVIDPEEQCDGDDLNGQTCDAGDRNPGGITCSATCQIDRSSCGGFCGDGIQQATWESCDGSDFGGAGCSNHAPGSTGGTLACTNSCEADVTRCTVCGDNVIDSGEQCDTGNNNDETCDSLGAGIGGELRCTGSCQFDVSNCGSCGDGVCQFAGTENSVTCANDCAYSKVAAGAIATCALRGPGQPWCWGYGESVGPSLDAPFPTPLPNSPFFKKLTAGRQHFCALTVAGAVYCWGVGYDGQLGNGDYITHTSPVPVDLGTDVVVALEAGQDHTCAIIADGRVFCWGINHDGCLGSGLPIPSSNVPVQVIGVNDATGLAAGFGHTCAVRNSGEIACWGHGGSGALGDGLSTSSATPVAVLNISDAVKISAGLFFTCALRAMGQVLCWGANDFSQLGLGGGGPNTSAVPNVLFSQPTGMVRIESGFHHTCAVGQDDRVYCWGDSVGGKLGRLTTQIDCEPTQAGHTIDSVVRADTSLLSPITRVTAAEAHSCALDTDGTIYCWGLDSGGLLGQGPSVGDCVSYAQQVTNQ